MAARMLLSCILLLTNIQAVGIGAEQAGAFIREQVPELLGDGSQLTSVYFFGQSHDYSVVGLERVGEDYLPIRWLMIFENDQVLGWYYPSDEFPLRYDSGFLRFPKGTGIQDVSLLPTPPSQLLINKNIIPFYPFSSRQ